MVKTAAEPNSAVALPLPRERQLRADIQALRAIAVVAVLIFHLWPNRLPGGYVGVDVFFVISGFLITSHLLRELEATGRIRLGRFWAKRAKRLLPASLLVLALTALAVVVWVPRSLWEQFLSEVGASAVYLQNWLLAANSVDYLAANNTASPVQHYWTLSTEEQFYVVLPLLLIGVTVLGRRLSTWTTRTLCFSAIGAVTIASLAYSIWLTSANESVAYFSTATRAWEFGAGAILAFIVAKPSARARPVLAVGGVAAILVSTVLFTGETAFPGYAALLPVVGTLLVIWAGHGTVIARAGEIRPIAFVGRVSYAIYLWHWPLIILFPFVIGRPLDGAGKVAIVIVSVAAAWMSTAFIEDPVRSSPRLLGRRRPAVVAAWSAAATLVVLVMALTPVVVSTAQARQLAQAEAEVVQLDPSCFGAKAMDPQAAPCENPSLDGILVPASANAQDDDSNKPACWATGGEPKLSVCQLGPASGYDKHLIAVGDSHNNTLIAAYEKIATDNNWRIDVAGKAGCYWTAALQQVPDFDVTPCASWRKDLAQHLVSAGPFDAVITTHSAADNLPLAAPDGTVESAIVDGLVAAWGPVASSGTPVIALRDNPRSTPDALSCVENEGLGSGDSCAIPRDVALGAFDGSAEAVELVPGSSLIDLTDMFCSATECPGIIGHVNVYRDVSHLTATYARTLAPYLGSQIRGILDATAP